MADLLSIILLEFSWHCANFRIENPYSRERREPKFYLDLIVGSTKILNNPDTFWLTLVYLQRDIEEHFKLNTVKTFRFHTLIDSTTVYIPHFLFAPAKSIVKILEVYCVYSTLSTFYNLQFSIALLCKSYLLNSTKVTQNACYLLFQMQNILYCTIYRTIECNCVQYCTYKNDNTVQCTLSKH